MPSSFSFRRRDKLLPPLRYRLPGNLHPLPGCSKDNLTENTSDETNKSSSLNLPKRAKHVWSERSGSSGKHVSSQRSESSYNLEPSLDGVKENASERTFGETSQSSSSKRRKRAKPVSSQRSGTCNSEKLPVSSTVLEQTLEETTKSSSSNLRKRAKSVSSKRSVSSDNLDPLPGGSSENTSEETFDDATKSSFNLPKYAKHVSSQRNESSCVFEPSLDGIKENVSEETFGKKINLSSFKLHKLVKSVSSKRSVSSDNIEQLPGGSKNKISGQTFDVSTKPLSFNPRKHVKSVSSKRNVSSDNFESLPSGSKMNVSEQTFDEKINLFSYKLSKRVKPVSSKRSVSSDNIEQLPGGSKNNISEQTFDITTKSSSFNPHKRVKSVSFKRSVSSDNIEQLPGGSKNNISEETFDVTTKPSSFNPRKRVKSVSSKRSVSLDNFEPLPCGSKESVSEQTFVDTTKSSSFNFYKHVSSQRSESSYNLDPLPGCSKDYFSEQTFEETTESSFNPRKCAKHVSSQSSGSAGNLNSLPGFPKTAISEQTCEETSDSSLNPRKDPSQSSTSSSNLDLLSGSSKNTVSEQTFNSATSKNSSKNSESKQLAVIPLNIIKTRLERFIPGRKNIDDFSQIAANHCGSILTEILKSATDYMKQCGRSKFTTEDFYEGISICGLYPRYFSSETAEKKTKSKVKRKKPTSQGNIEEKASEDKKLESIPQSSSSQEVRTIKETWVNDGNPLSVNIEDLAEELQDYFKTVVVILYYNMKEEGCVISKDLQTNRNLIELIPHFVDFFCKVIDEFENDFLKVSLVFKFIDALLQNPYVYFGQDSHLNILFCSLFKFLVANLQESGEGSLDCWALKDSAEKIVSLVLKRSKSQHLYFEAMYLVNSVLMSNDSLSSCYGALVILNALGVPAILDLLPSYIEKFYEKNETVLGSNRVAVLVQGQIIHLYYVLVDYYLKNEDKRLEFNLPHLVQSPFLFPDYLNDIKVLPVLSDFEETLSSYAGEVLLPAKIRLLNFASSRSTNLRRIESTKQDMKGSKKQTNKKFCFRNYPLLLGTII